MKTEVREVFHKGASVVVEWRDIDGNLHRSIFPESAVITENGVLFVEAVEEGQPYGVAWEDYINTSMGANEIAAMLRNKGIWTLEDYRTKTPVVTAVFSDAASLNAQSFRDSVLRQGKDDK